MILIALIFLTILFVAFGVLAVMMRPTTEESSLQRRVALLILPHGQYGSEGDNVDRYLEAADPGVFGWIDDLLADTTVSRRIRLLLLQSQSTWSVGTVLISMAGLGILALLITYVVTAALPIAVGVMVAAAYLPLLVLKVQRQRRLTAFNNALPDSIEMMARSLRAGHALAASIGIVAESATEPVKSEFAEVFKKQNYGLSLRDAMLQLLDRVPSSDLQVLVTGVLVQKDTGGNLAEILDRIVAVIRDRVRIHGEIRTHTAQGRLTGWILCLLPVVMLVALNIVNPGYSKVLFTTDAGKKMMYTGVALLVAGMLVIRKIINGIEV